MTKAITVLGSTGSIGTQALGIIEENPSLFRVQALACAGNIGLLAEQARKFRPRTVAVADDSLYSELKGLLRDTPVKVLAGGESMEELASDAENDLVINAVVGFAGLKPTLAALQAGKRLALANKESLVAGGSLVMEAACAGHAEIIPVDSEHSAIFQCLRGEDSRRVEKIILTASGGPFFGWSEERLKKVRPQDALKHPNWRMGKKITIDSATLMNKGLEVIEAHWLFGAPYDKIEVVVHRESIIHSMVAFQDGAILAQLGMPDMRVPIQFAMTYPDRLPGNAMRISWDKVASLSFATPDTRTFRCLELAYQAGRTGGSMPAVLNAANEEAVAMFLEGTIPFTAIPCIIEEVMNKHKLSGNPTISELTDIDSWSRQAARDCAQAKGWKTC